MVDAFAHVSLFARLSPPDREALVALMTRRTAGAGDTIFWVGDPGETLYVVEAGRVVITVPDEQGAHVVLDTLGPGHVFGEISLLDGGPRTATVRALGDTTLLELSREAFHQFLRQHPEVGIEILHLMGVRQRASTAAIRGLKNPNAVIAESTTVWQRVSDLIAATSASQTFSLVHVAWFGSWIILNVLGGVGVLPEALAFDPYPFGLLTLIVSLEAIFLAIFVLVSQNRQAERDRIRTDLDYQVNVKAHLEIVGLARRLDRIEQGIAQLTPAAQAERIGLGH